ncbi:MAG: hypothetical protein GY856_37395 [bacterium]|nr:hypothetical protein [bacterium]
MSDSSDTTHDADAAVECVRCGRTAVAASNTGYSGEMGEEIASKICGACWNEWQRAEVMVINELRLDFMDPRSQEVLVTHMRDFLMLGPAAAGD